MNRHRLCALLLAVLLLLGIVGWYLFRPEKAFLDDVVDEPFPAQASPGTAPVPNSNHPPTPAP